MTRIVLVSNRVQVPSSREPQSGGLAVALGDLLERRGGLWFGWSGKVTDDPASAQKVAFATVGSVQYATVDLSREEHARYYNDFSNGTLWPMLHSMPQSMEFDRKSAESYRHVNARMADALAPLLRPDDSIWVHDYHLMALPALLRARGVSAPIGFFLHVPFPSPDMLASVPESAALVRDLLDADLLGFQTANDVDNFCLAATRLLGATRLSAPPALQHGRRRTRIGAFPVEIEARAFAENAKRAVSEDAAAQLRASLRGEKLILGVDRLDPTKGIPQRLAGYRRLLETRPEWRRHTTFLQISAQSRTDVEAYQDLREEVDREAGAVNGDWGEPDWVPLRMVARGGARDTIAGYMRIARVGLVTPLRDGMNLVAKEFVAAQDPDDPGVLVLSRFAGAAQQLDSALLVNPRDPDGIAEALSDALRMKLAERRARWRACWGAVEHATPASWGRAFLAALAGTSAMPEHEDGPLWPVAGAAGSVSDPARRLN